MCDVPAVHAKGNDAAHEAKHGMRDRGLGAGLGTAAPNDRDISGRFGAAFAKLVSRLMCGVHAWCACVVCVSGVREWCA